MTPAEDVRGVPPRSAFPVNTAEIPSCFNGDEFTPMLVAEGQ